MQVCCGSTARIAPLQVKPEQQIMLGAENLDYILGNQRGLLVKQTPRGCLLELMGCTAKSEYKISGMEPGDIQDGYKISENGMKQQNVLYALEESNCLIRNFAAESRPMTVVVTDGGEAGGAEVMRFVKPATFPLCSCNCCPLMSVELPGGQKAESQVYIDFPGCLIPHFKYQENDKHIYNVHPEKCCGGFCISCDICKGKGTLYMPFYFHDPNTKAVIGGEYDDPSTPQIRKLWAGLAMECCTTADNFAITFPPGVDGIRKAGLLGLTFLLDFAVFEKKKESNN